MTSVAAPADRVRLASQRQRVLALSRHRLMLCLLLFLGLTLLIGARLVWLTVLGDRSATTGLGDGTLPERADIVDRNGVSLAQTFDAWSIGVHPNKLLGNRREVADAARHGLLPAGSVAEMYALLDPAVEAASTSLCAAALPRGLPPRSMRSASLPSPSNAGARTALSADQRWPAMSSAGPISTASALPAWNACSTNG